MAQRTTVMLEEELYRAIKRTAVDRARPMRVLVEEALRMYLGFSQGRSKASHPKFGVYRFRVKGDLRRATIYGDRT